jgi:2-aminoadipate transaminase
MSTTSLPTDHRWSSSAIRDLLAHAQAPGVISLAGGLPAAGLLPVERLREGAAEVFERGGARSLQYGVTAGEPALCELVGSFESVRPDDLVITAGSQQALDLVARTVTRPGDMVIVEVPGYVGALQVLRANGLELIGCAVDDDGFDTAQLEHILARGGRPALVYVNPNHQNPTGGSLSPERQRHLVWLADRYGFWIIVDDPYREITLDGPVPSPTQGLHPSTNDGVLLLGSMSKTLSPGLRIGWCSGRQDVIERLQLAKQATDLHTATFNQLLAAAVLSDHDWWVQHLHALRTAYRQRRDHLAEAVDRHLPDAIVTPQSGGFFLWLDLPGVDTSALLDSALETGVAFVPGAAFTIGDSASSTLRLSYSFADTDRFDDALRRLATSVGRARR